MNKLDKYLKEVKERCDAATEGPWRVSSQEFEHRIYREIEEPPIDTYGFAGVDDYYYDSAVFMAHARQDVEVLLEMVNFLKAQNEYLKNTLTRRYGDAVVLEEMEKLVPKEMRDEC